ncbi:outer membrane lipoprotein LolB [Natronospira proteinivora]|uniref:Outer-membrane lipoprotein LolB n=1 Tax=Natronospira proteinivora TaxID=1807133 RepID=A0ABT1G8Y1_9GAMM|nr:lipoprotein insertase outer membrane protein LolB [Natronospira proteinivora]MCP1727360.1 outer membrane lipoprotein LolB [Natronospira proteinivora]
MGTTTRVLSGLFVLLLLAGCARMAPVPEGPPDEAAWQEHQRALLALQAWSLDGRVALRSEDDGWTASLRWSQWTDYMDFRLRGTFGIGTTRIRGSEEGMIIENSRGDVWETAHPEVELERQTGWRVPLGMLRWWMVGMPAPQGPTADKEIDALGRLVQLEQLGWEIHYEDYGDVGELMLPHRITVENESVRLRIRVRDWTVGDSQPLQSRLSPLSAEAQER